MLGRMACARFADDSTTISPCSCPWRSQTVGYGQRGRSRGCHGCRDTSCWMVLARCSAYDEPAGRRQPALAHAELERVAVGHAGELAVEWASFRACRLKAIASCQEISRHGLVEFAGIEARRTRRRPAPHAGPDDAVTGMRSSSSTSSTPTCAAPFAPPPPSTRPMRGAGGLRSGRPDSGTADGADRQDRRAGEPTHGQHARPSQSKARPLDLTRCNLCRPQRPPSYLRCRAPGCCRHRSRAVQRLRRDAWRKKSWDGSRDPIPAAAMNEVAGPAAGVQER